MLSFWKVSKRKGRTSNLKRGRYIEGSKKKKKEPKYVHSEIALDLELWDRSDAELQERMYETVLEETEKKNELEKVTNQIQVKRKK